MLMNMQLLSFEKKRRLHFCYPKTGISLLFGFQYVKWHTIDSHIMWCINNPIGYSKQGWNSISEVISSKVRFIHYPSDNCELTSWAGEISGCFMITLWRPAVYFQQGFAVLSTEAINPYSIAIENSDVYSMMKILVYCARWDKDVNSSE